MKKHIIGLVLLGTLVVGASPAEAQTTDTDLIATLTAQIAQLQAQIAALLDAPATPITQTLAVGSTGSEVSALQTFLKSKGFYTFPTVTGYFGGVTEAAVKAYQASEGLSAVGIVGPATRDAINKSRVAKPAVVAAPKPKEEPAKAPEPEPETFQILLPNGGETWREHSVKTIYWTYDIEAKDDRMDIMIDAISRSCAEDYDPRAERCKVTRTFDINLRSSNDGSQTWEVGEAFDNISRTEPDLGYFVMHLKNRETGVELFGDAPFEIVGKSGGLNKAPVINDFEGPERVTAGESETWVAVASDEEGEELSFQVDWGDGKRSNIVYDAGGRDREILFDHTYSTRHIGKELVMRLVVMDETGDKAYRAKEIRVTQY